MKKFTIEEIARYIQNHQDHNCIDYDELGDVYFYFIGLDSNGELYEPLQNCKPEKWWFEVDWCKGSELNDSDSLDEIYECEDLNNPRFREVCKRFQTIINAYIEKKEKYH